MLINRSIPPGEIIPKMPYADVRQTVDWLCSRFGFVERLRIGVHRAQLAFGEGSIVVTDGGSGPKAGYAVYMRVANVDEHE